jgi:hypothetical protein
MTPFQEMVESLYGEMDKIVSLLRMGFTEEEVSLAIDNFGKFHFILFNIVSFLTTFTRYCQSSFKR